VKIGQGRYSIDHSEPGIIRFRERFRTMERFREQWRKDVAMARTTGGIPPTLPVWLKMAKLPEWEVSVVNQHQDTTHCPSCGLPEWEPGGGGPFCPGCYEFQKSGR